MKFTSLLTSSISFFALQSLAAPAQKKDDDDEAAAGAGTKFALMSIRSASPVHLLPIKTVESHPFVFSVGGTEGDFLVVTLQEDGSLKTDDGQLVYNKPDTNEFGFGTNDEEVTKGFYLGETVLQNEDLSFYACPSAEGYSLTSSSYDGCYGISLLYSEDKDSN